MLTSTPGWLSRFWRIFLATSAVAVAHQYSAPWRTAVTPNSAPKADVPASRDSGRDRVHCRVISA